MSMLEQMARRLAMDALERVKPGTYTSVVDEIWLYGTEDGGKYKVSDQPGNGSEDAPVLDSTDACERMVAMMAEQAGAIVVVPEDAPMDSHLVQIAQLLVNSADVPTDASDVADGAAIVGTVKAALAYLDAARDDNRIKREKIAKLELLLSESRDMNKAAQAEIERLNDQIQRWNIGTNELQDKYLAAQQEIGALTAKLEEARRSIKRNVDEAANCQARYEAMTEALRIVLELAGVGK